jgi:hypothetical protein
VVAVRAAHDDARGAVIDVSLGEDPDSTTSCTGQCRGSDIASEHFREGARGGVTVDMRRFCHHSFFLD